MMVLHVQSTFPRLKRGQRCHYQTTEGFVDGHVSQVFDQGFVVTLDNGSVIRFLRDKWDDSDAAALLWLTRKGKPMRKRWYHR